MRARIAVVGVLVGLLVFVPAGSAAGGGWWTYFDTGSGVFATEHDVELKHQVLFESIAEADEARAGETPYFVYLLRNFDYDIVARAQRSDYRSDWWEVGGATATQVGRVTFGGQDSNLIWATARLSVPDLEPGRYYMMLCTIGCARAMANVIPVAVTITADPLAAKIAQRAMRAEERLMENASEVGRLRRELRVQTRALEDRIDGQREEIGNLIGSVDRLATSVREQSASKDSSLGVLWLAIGVVIGVVATLLGRRRRSAEPPFSEADLELLRTAETDQGSVLSPR